MAIFDALHKNVEFELHNAVERIAKEITVTMLRDKRLRDAHQKINFNQINEQIIFLRQHFEIFPS